MKKRELVEQAVRRHNVPSGVEKACEMLSDDIQDLLGLGDDQYGETADSVAEFAAQLLGNQATLSAPFFWSKNDGRKIITKL